MLFSMIISIWNEEIFEISRVYEFALDPLELRSVETIRRSSCLPSRMLFTELAEHLTIGSI